VAAENEDFEVLQESIHFVLEESDKFLPFDEEIELSSSQAEDETVMDNSERRRIVEDTSEFPSFGLEHVLHRIKKMLTKGEIVVLENNEKLQYRLWMLAMKRKLEIILRKLPQHLKARLKNNGSPSACAWLRKFPTESRTFFSDEKVRFDLSFRLLSDQYTRSEYSDITNQLGLEKTKRVRIRDEDADEEQQENAAEYETIDEEEEGEKKEKEDDEEEEEEEEEEELFSSHRFPKRSGLISTSSPVLDLDRDPAEDVIDFEAFPSLSRSNLQSSVTTPSFERHPLTDFETSSDGHMKRKKIENKNE
jgi:hypothetical protein